MDFVRPVDSNSWTGEMLLVERGRRPGACEFHSIERRGAKGGFKIGFD